MISPYLIFDGNCHEAMEFYKSALGGENTYMTFGDAPMDTPPEMADRVMHATLANDQLSFMAADAMPGNGHSPGSSIHLSISGVDEDRIRACYEGLKEGGQVTMPLEKQFWGDTFGMLTDKFGFEWMFNIGSGDQGGQ
jgi:PhnB protein